MGQSLCCNPVQSNDEDHYSAKIECIIVGEPKVGISCLASAYEQKEYLPDLIVSDPEETLTGNITIGVDIYEFNI